MSYIGNSPGVASQRVQTSFTATSGQTVFTPSAGYTLGYLDVYQNGVKLIVGDDYTASDGVIFTLTTAASVDDAVECVAYFPRGLSDGYTKAEADTKYPTKANNLSDLASASTARTNLGLGTAATQTTATFLQTSNNLSDVTASTARTNLGLAAIAASGSASDLSTGTVPIARIGSGTKDATTFLRGDNSFATVSVTPTAVSDQNNSSTGFFDLPTGTTAQRPASPTTGMTRFNTTRNALECYDGTSWMGLQSTSYPIEYLVIAGAGGGGCQAGGGGGAGGYRSSVIGESSGGNSSAEATITLVSAINYSVTIGAGGAGSPTGGNGSRPAGSSGSNSSFDTIISIGGGGGGSYRPQATGGLVGLAGGSGGGGSIWYGLGGAGTSGQGFAGGQGGTDNGDNTDTAGGGGGAGAVGVSYGSGGGNGGSGLQSSINGTATYRAGGGGGGCHATNHASGTGGAGGGGRGGANTGDVPTAGTVNTGGGGGGSPEFTDVGAQGGSGIVIIRYAGAQRGTGGTYTTSGGYSIHTFTSSGTYTA